LIPHGLGMTDWKYFDTHFGNDEMKCREWLSPAAPGKSHPWPLSECVPR